VRLLALLVAVAALLVVYGYWTARRLDRLHARVDAAAAALDAQLRLRAETAAEFTGRADISVEAITRVAEAASVAAEAPGLGHDREIVENALSRTLTAIHADEPAAFDPARASAAALLDAMTRASFARRFHNDAVRDALVVRRRRVVRWLRLAGRAPLPAYFEMDDTGLLRSVSVAAQFTGGVDSGT
jgi:hypothetical protein